MIEKIKAGIAQKLDSAFEDVPIYTDRVPQDTGAEFFYIKSIREDEVRVMGRRYMRNYSIDVQFFAPQATSSNARIDVVKEQLYELMGFVLVDGLPIVGTSMNTEAVDNVLHFMVQYKLPVVRQVTPEDSMETMTQNLTV